MVAWLDDTPFPSRFDDPKELDDFLSRPSRTLAAELAAINGDIIVLGVAGKMGPTLARLARNAAPDKSVIGVARFTEAGLREKLKACGVETIACDLSDPSAAATLPLFVSTRAPMRCSQPVRSTSTGRVRGARLDTLRLP